MRDVLLGCSAKQVLALLLMLGAGPAMAQSAPPDLEPKLTGGSASKPLSGRTVEQPEKPRLQEPPRAPVAPEGVLSSPSVTTSPAR